jgi:hypothetical protein
MCPRQPRSFKDRGISFRQRRGKGQAKLPPLDPIEQTAQVNPPFRRADPASPTTCRAEIATSIVTASVRTRTTPVWRQACCGLPNLDPSTCCQQLSPGWLSLARPALEGRRDPQFEKVIAQTATGAGPLAFPIRNATFHKEFQRADSKQATSLPLFP